MATTSLSFHRTSRCLRDAKGIMGIGARSGEPVRLALVGCGGMVLRHLHGLADLRRFRDGDIRLVAVCDPAVERAATLASEAERLLRDTLAGAPRGAEPGPALGRQRRLRRMVRLWEAEGGRPLATLRG